MVRELSPAAAGGECGAAHRLATVVMCKMYTIESPSRVRMNSTSATALPHQRSACVTAPPLAAPWAHNIFAWRSPGSVSGTVPHPGEIHVFSPGLTVSLAIRTFPGMRLGCPMASVARVRASRKTTSLRGHRGIVRCHGVCTSNHIPAAWIRTLSTLTGQRQGRCGI